MAYGVSDELFRSTFMELRLKHFGMPCIIEIQFFLGYEI